ncbi:MAG: carbamoyltransferase [Candidatus Omnitrophica bacterium]|nr:carbamoyltransferase [Candidatus Omnitrophota bacterium]
MNILGISAYYHDSAAALIKDGKVVAAAQEERFTRKKHDFGFPKNAVDYCLKAGGIEVSDLDHVGFYDKPLLKFERILSTYIATFPRSFPSFFKAMPMWLHEKLWVPQLIKEKLGFKKEIFFIEHHLSHASSAFLASPFAEAAILTIDGVGEWTTAAYGVGKGNDIDILKEIRFPHSLGLLYNAFTYYLGFKVNNDEYKVMGLAPYGEPVYYDLIMDNLISVKADGSFRMNMKYFAYDYGLRMTNRNFDSLFGGPRRSPESELTQKDKNLAASIQKVTEEIVLRMANHIHKETGQKKLCMAGGVALNCVANGRILRETPFEDVFIQPAAGDAGCAIGVASYIYYTLLKNKRTKDAFKNAYLGPDYSDTVKDYLVSNNIEFEEFNKDDLVKKVTQILRKKKVVGWLQGKMEFGPRALGSRSILADPTNPDAKYTVNSKIKFREEFRPFAPTVLLDKAKDFFELDKPSPFMLLVAQVKKDKRFIPAVTHVNGSARIQTITKEDHPIYYDLINEFYKQSGCPILLNTSFNLRGEPIVCTPHDAYLCFMRSGIDYLVMGNFLLDKTRMKTLVEKEDYRRKYKMSEIDKD